MERFPSGQREQTVNLLSVTSVVRIHPSPPRKSVLFGTDFLLLDNPLPFSSIFVALPRRKSLLSVHTRTKTPATIPQDCLLAIQAEMCFFIPFYFCLNLLGFVGFCCVLLPKVLPQIKKSPPHYMNCLILVACDELGFQGFPFGFGHLRPPPLCFFA